MRLIDADALEWFRVTLSNGQTCILICKSHINELPTVDAEPVRHGEWKPYYEVMEVFTDVYLNTEEREVQTGWECSVCGRYSPGDPAEMPYCHCGAKMDGGKQDVDADGKG